MTMNKLADRLTKDNISIVDKTIDKTRIKIKITILKNLNFSIFHQ